MESDSPGPVADPESPRRVPPPLSPPPLPGPEPPQYPAPESEAWSEERLHPATLLMALIRAIRSMVLPLIFVAVAGSLETAGIFLFGFMALSLLAAAVRYFTFSYRLVDGELITRQGLFSRQERHIPLARVQDLRIEAGLIHRLLGVVDVRVETAGGEGIEAELSVLARERADALRGEGFHFRGGPAASASASGAATTPDEQVLSALSTRDLVVEGLTSNRAASVFVLLGAGVGVLIDLLPRSRWEELWNRYAKDAAPWLWSGAGVSWPVILLLAALVLLLSTLFSVVEAVVLFHGYSLVRRGEDLFRSYGLFARRASSVPRRRIQVLEVVEPWLRRRFGWAAVRADTAGRATGDEEARKGGRDVLLPLVRRERVAELVPVFLPDGDPEPAQWEQVAPCAVRRATAVAVFLCLILSLFAALGPFRNLPGWGQLHALWFLCLIPLLHWIHRRTYRHLGYADTGRIFRTRRGWLSRRTHIVPVRNLQVVILRQSPLDRRHDVWTLKLDTAGQAFTGGGPVLRNVSTGKVLPLGRALAERAANTRFRV